MSFVLVAVCAFRHYMLGRCAIAQVRSPKARQQTRRSVADQALFRCYKMIFVSLITLSFTSYTLKPELDVLGVLLALFEHHH